ncbi:MAG: 2-hydroxyacyl-CoA dehydratase family protein [Vulcanibacillus sp.]
MKKIGLTTTAPIEVLIASGYTPVDLNNIFVTSNSYLDYIDIAEREGFPKNVCAWIKGIYGACIAHNIEGVVGIVEGDCSNTKALLDVLKLKGVKVYPFSYPYSHKKEDVKIEIDKFIKIFGSDINKVEIVRKRLANSRNMVKKIDELTYRENKVSGYENHLYQVSMSDLNGNIENYEKELMGFIEKAEKSMPRKSKLRLAYIGVPPITTDIYEFVEKLDSRIVYNEVQREFAFPRADKALNIYDQYHDYTYPYDLDFRIAEIKKQVDERNIDGIIHYTQAFCYKAINDIIIKKNIDVPILTIEGDKLNVLDARTKLRIEAFLDMLLDSTLNEVSIKGGHQ